MAKVDTEQSPALAQSCVVQSVPDVRFFKDGEMVDGFVGAIQEGEIQKLLDKYVVGGGHEGLANQDYLFHEKKMGRFGCKTRKGK